ncbi:hypothetical protein ATI61_106411 [Archangium gephyra]|uniref:Uncharacterized protein n=1 Tax=Archangium gephyra TaxID=48 RepID=A0AAC8Q1F5_9BACT|nr:hypothetical protein [Archangium gephyra]AKI99031.1 Hypothetical protein AA314_00658 [Archangium gephyra]REG30941.1 hypothetical protein ATI61_106411 [Archangium gephyra]
MKKPLRVIVLGEGKDERGKPRTLPPFARVPHDQQGAMEILIRRALYPLLNHGQSWHPGLKDDDGIHILQPLIPRFPRQPSMVEVLSDPNALYQFVVPLKPVRGPPLVDLIVATHDADAASPAVIKAVHVVNTNLGIHVPLIQPAPEIQAWLTSKRAIELAYKRDYCTVPVPDEDALKKDAKAELQRLLRTFGGSFNAKMQASLAEKLPVEELGRYDWSGWNQATEILAAALAENGLETLEL